VGRRRRDRLVMLGVRFYWKGFFWGSMKALVLTCWCFRCGAFGDVRLSMNAVLPNRVAS